MYLHVLTSNKDALQFYEHRHFRKHHFLPCYYVIKGAAQDGFSYVRYVNGGEPPTTFLYPFHANVSELILSAVYVQCICFVSLYSSDLICDIIVFLMLMKLSSVHSLTTVY